MKEIKKFIDTNILVYAHDYSAGDKHKIAKQIILDLWDTQQGIISTQVLQEFFTIVTKKIPKPLDTNIAKEIINDLMKWNVFINDKQSIIESIEIHCRYKYSFWDSMIIQAAVRSGSAVLLSEDLCSGQIVDDVEIKNPFERI